MKRTRNSIEALAQVSKGVVPLLAASLFIPVLILAVIGVVSLIQDGRWLLFAVLVAISSVAVIIPYVLFRNLRKVDEQALETIPDYDVEPPASGVTLITTHGKPLNQRIDTLLNINSEWDGLRDHALVLAMEVAEKYHPRQAVKRACVYRT